MTIEYWRASTSLRLVDALLDWASETSVEFSCGDKPIIASPLLELLMSRQPFPSVDVPMIQMEAFTATRRFTLRENINYEARVSTSFKAVNKLQSYLIEHTNEAKATFWLWLEGHMTKSW